MSYEIDHVYRFDEDDDKKKILGWCDVDDEDHEEEDGRRRKKMNNTNPNVFLNFLTEWTKTINGDKEKVLKRSFFLVKRPKRYQINT